MIPKHKALEYISEIRTVQDVKHGADRHTLPEWFIIIRRQLWEAEEAWYEGKLTQSLERVGHLGACACAALEHNASSPK